MRIHHGLLAALRGSSKPSPIPVAAAMLPAGPGTLLLPSSEICPREQGVGVCDPSNTGVQFGALTLCSGAGALLQPGQLPEFPQTLLQEPSHCDATSPGSCPAPRICSVGWPQPPDQGLRTLTLNKTQRTGLGAQSHQLPSLECLSHPPTIVNIARVQAAPPCRGKTAVELLRSDCYQMKGNLSTVL